MLSCQCIAPAGDGGAVEFVVLCVMVVNEACFGHDPAAGGIFGGMAAGKPITVRILEPVFY